MPLRGGRPRSEVFLSWCVCNHKDKLSALPSFVGTRSCLLREEAERKKQPPKNRESERPSNALEACCVADVFSLTLLVRDRVAGYRVNNACHAAKTRTRHQDGCCQVLPERGSCDCGANHPKLADGPDERGFRGFRGLETDPASAALSVDARQLGLPCIPGKMCTFAVREAEWHVWCMTSE